MQDKGCSSNGRALASHARGIGIDTPLLQLYFLGTLHIHLLHVVAVIRAYVSDLGGTTGVLDRGEMGFRKVEFSRAGYTVETPAGMVLEATRGQPIRACPKIRPKRVEEEDARTQYAHPLALRAPYVQKAR